MREDAGATGPVAVADTVMKLAVLLGAGAVPEAAWRHVAESERAAFEREDPAGAERISPRGAERRRTAQPGSSRGEPRRAESKGIDTGRGTAAVRISERVGAGRSVVEAIHAEADPIDASVVRRKGRRGPSQRGGSRHREARKGRDTDAAWRDVAAAWEVASTVGAPLAESLRGMAGALHDAQETMDEVRIALTEPANTSRLMGVLPLIGVVIAMALGFDVVGVLTTTAPGAICLGAGLCLILAARWWTRRLVRAAQPAPGTPGMRAELMAIALGGGVSLDRARTLVAAATGGDRSGADRGSGRGRRRRTRPTDIGTAADAETERVLELSRRAGIPAIDLLRATAAQQRHLARTEGRVRAARLGTRLLLPLGVCTLPAFVCLGVVPMLLAVLQSSPLPHLP